jgi:hypothetical protein
MEASMDVVFGRMRPRTGIMSKLEDILNLSSEQVDSVAIEWLFAALAAHYINGQLFFAPAGPNPEQDRRYIDFARPIFITPRLPETDTLLRAPVHSQDELLERLKTITGERRSSLYSIARSVLLETIKHRNNGLVLYQRVEKVYLIAGSRVTARGVYASSRILHSKIYPQ